MIILLSAVVAVLVVAGAVVWFNAESYEDKVADCKRAVGAYDFDAQPVEEGGTIPGCEDVKRDDYLALVLSNTIANMPKEDRDLLDYSDNGTIDGSIG
ncbi:hypothetical protein [Streptomyces sp. FL07-04A]|uniref:hypothetical protein n=1 Tax=Streptomyces sp. FL07-04A TaxID=3028658 RepID=UPI0029A361E2|nr:hypothetical protein [Streptomyces sp. FL07-04A]MDX3575961.1 hypothetical protein [Streptomyces sp. FL07-04A]